MKAQKDKQKCLVKLNDRQTDPNRQDLLLRELARCEAEEATLNQPQKPLGRYGRMRRMYLMENRPVLYNSMLLTGKLHPHLLEVEQAAENQKQQMMTELLKQNPAPDKAKNQLMWVQHMNSLKAQVEEVILMELIYN